MDGLLGLVSVDLPIEGMGGAVVALACVFICSRGGPSELFRLVG